jgi:hypothetical protein
MTTIATREKNTSVYKEDRKIDDNDSSDNKRKRTSNKKKTNDNNESDSIKDSSSISAPDDGIKDIYK